MFSIFSARTLECGNHQCDKVCHADDCKTCETLPEVVTHCPCGAMPLSDLSTVTRKSCTEPIPTCDEICNKSLGCGPQGTQKYDAYILRKCSTYQSCYSTPFY